MVERPRGTRDFSPEEMAKRRFLEQRLRARAESYGYREIATPAIEHQELFVAKSGPQVLKQTYAFKDRGGRDICLRPELTLPTMRYFAAELRAWPRPVRVFYHGPVWRYEEPQHGRHREFWQFGVELIGADSVEADAEVIALAREATAELGAGPLELRVGHVGVVRALAEAAGLDGEARRAVFPLLDKKDAAGLRAWLATAGLGDDIGRLLLRVAEFRGGPESFGPLRGEFDGVPGARAAVARLFAVLEALDRREVGPVSVDLAVVRGLDYYTGVVFELHSPNLGAESQCGGGGAYDLSEVFGLPPEGTVGFGLGFDRLAMLVPPSALPADRGSLDVLVAAIGDGAAVLRLAADAERRIRQAGARVERDVMGRGPGKNLKYADARGARFAVLVGEKEAADGRVTLRDLRSGDQAMLAPADAALRIQSDLGCA
ncbi:MAG TPA: histidine--tRNA ligase [Candidatus Thermoplasmatota archaeon]